MSSTRDTAGQPKRAPLRRDIQGLRALAVLSVVVYHAGLPLRGGFAGVDVFFTISGFVITAMLLREARRGGTISLVRFYQRRFQRLTPALAVVVLATLCGSALLLTPFGQQQIAGKTALGATFFIANAVIAKGTGGYFDPAASTNPLLHTWSLSVEEQFYFVYPITVLMGLRYFRKGLPWLIAGVSSASLILATVGATTWPLGFYSPVTRAWEFGIGALVAMLELKLPYRVNRWFGWLGLALLAFSFIVLSSATKWPGPLTTMPTLGTAVCLMAGGSQSRTSSTTRLLGTTALKKVGDYSYSIYLWHWPFICLATSLNGTVITKVIAALLSLIPAILSYHYVEEPFRKRPLHGKGPWLIALAACFATSVMAVSGLSWGVQRGWWIPSVQNVESKTGTHLGWDQCLRLDTGGNGARQINKAACTFGDSSSKERIYLVGDSNASMYSDPASQAALSTHRQLVIRTAAGCSLADLYRSSGTKMTASDRLCRSFVSETLGELTSASRGTIVYIAESPTQWLLPGRGESLHPNNFAISYGDRAAVMREGLRRTITVLQSHGLRPILVEPIVTFRSSTPPNTAVMCRTTMSLLLGRCPSAVSLKDAEPHDTTLRADILSLAQNTGIPSVKIASRQCPRETCPPTIQGAPVLMDAGEHLSAAFARQLSPDFTEAARRAEAASR